MTGVPDSLANQSEKPNVILILTDDLGFGDLSCYGATGQRTPNLDQLGREGVRFTDFYMSAPVCSPSRASILTGCYHKRVNINRVLWPLDVSGIHPEEQTIGEILQQNGYSTAYFGKWHVGDQAAFLPLRQGFERFHGIPYSHDMRSLVKLKKERGQLSPLHLRVLPLVRDEKVTELITSVEPLMPAYDSEIENFIDASVEAGKPFFVYLAHHAVHLPLEPSASFDGTSSNGKFGDWIQQIDSHVGSLLGFLESRDLGKNTVVIFTSDNGPSKRSSGSTGPLRGYKHSTWEGGVRVPFLAWWPGKIPPDSVCREIGASMDILPTIASIAGIDLDDVEPIDGVDLSPLLFGQETEPPRQIFAYYNGQNLAAVRYGDWKLHLKTPGRPRRKNVLFNLRNDVGESDNVARENPKVVDELKELAERFRLELGDGTRKGYGERKPGRAVNIKPLFEALSHPKEEGDDFADENEE